MPTPSHKHSNVPAVEVNNLTIRFGTTNVIQDVSFKIAQGGLVALLGPNGSGKTTLMRAMLGLQPYQRGSIRLFGHDVQEHYGSIGYVPQRFSPDRTVPMTVEEFLDIARHKHVPPRRLKEALEEVGLNPVTTKRKQLGNLSGGQLQRVLIARAIMHHPDILFLDEPSTGIDIAGEQTLFELLATLNKDHNLTVIMISHEVNMVATHVDQVLCLNKCLVCAGPPKKALSKKSLEELYGRDYIDAHQHKH